MIFHIKQIPSETKIRRDLRQIIFSQHPHCPRCQSRLKASEGRYWCRKCRVHISLLSGTYLRAMKLSLRMLWALVWCYCLQIPVKQTRVLLNLSDEAVRRSFGLFRAQIPQEYGVLRHQVQLDEAFFFGKRGKALMLGKQVGTRDLAYAVHNTSILDRTTATQFLFQHVQPRSRLQTDGGGIYKGIDQWWPVDHRTDIHKKWEFGLTSEIEGMFGNLRTFLRRMYHHIRPEYFEEYVGEFCARFSHPEMFRDPLTFLKTTLPPVPFD